MVSLQGNRAGKLHWAVHSRWLRPRVPVHLRHWLLDAGSLTDRIRQTCQGQFRVRVIDEGWQRPRRDETQALSMRPATLGWVRQVQLLCDDKPWVFARTVIPLRTLSGAQRQLVHLGNRPLGAFLFADPRMRREAVELACITPGRAMYRQASTGLARQPECLWGRRSVFRVGGKPLLVTEIFLPGFETTP